MSQRVVDDRTIEARVEGRSPSFTCDCCHAKMSHAAVLIVIKKPRQISPTLSTAEAVVPIIRLCKSCHEQFGALRFP